MKLFIILSGFLILTVFSCKKEKSQNEISKDLVKVEILNPKDSSSFKMGDSILITAVATSKIELHGYLISINNSNNEIVYQNSYRHIHGKEFMIADKISLNLIPGEYFLNVLIYIDHSGLTVFGKRRIQIES